MATMSGEKEEHGGRRIENWYSDDEESNGDMSDDELEDIRAMLSEDLTDENSELYPEPGWALNSPRAPVDPQILIQRALEQKTELAELALKFYNSIHNTSYELVEALKCLVVFPEEHYHLNFTAKLPEGPDTSPKLFFAELQEDEDFYSYEDEANRLTACVIMEQGEGKRSCASCSEVDGLLHPLDGFCYGVYQSVPMRILYSDDEEESNWEMSDGELERIRAMLSADLTYEKSELYPGPGWSLNCPRAPVDPQILIERALEQKTELTELALKFYNIIHNTSYELVEALKCLVVFPEEHYHLNFTAKLPEGPDTSPKLFFAELQEDEGFYNYEGEENRLTACVIMEQGEGKRSCASCSEDDGLLHPLDGFCYGKPSVMANTNPFRRPLSTH
ncbi:unnamed protein product [Cuscuta epithymum]|uniref:DUF3615 domain-containing protein n=1 Tax=Cuscuta epithymum TaxID=186058 RepID=A0AAV0CEI0_9ASTE|nr:unnamed protein product [Cuscuta epithymum]